MADRTLVYVNEVPFDVDILNSQKNYLEAVAGYIDTVTGNSTYVNGFNCIPSTPPALTVDVEPGQIYSLEQTDPTAYGSVPADLRLIMQQGIMADAITLSTPAPITIGDSIKYLVQAAFQQTDGIPVNRTFLSAPSQLVDTQRQALADVNVKSGVSAPTGTEVAPAPDAGFTGLWVITVAFGQTTVTAPNIAVDVGAPFITEKLQDKISQATADARYVKLPPLGNSGYIWTFSGGTIMAGTGNTLMPITQDSGPLVWIAGNKFQPTFACIMVFHVHIGIATPVANEMQFEAIKNGNALQWAQTTLPSTDDQQMVIPLVIEFNGTTDYVEFYAANTLGTANTVNVARATGAVIAN